MNFNDFQSRVTHLNSGHDIAEIIALLKQQALTHSTLILLGLFLPVAVV
jgi:hypothetical protein